MRCPPHRLRGNIPGWTSPPGFRGREDARTRGREGVFILKSALVALFGLLLVTSPTFAAAAARDLRSEHWQTLTGSREAVIADRARKLEKSSGRAPTPDKAKLIDALTPQVEKGGDAAKGKLVFVKNCAVCHTLGS